MKSSELSLSHYLCLEMNVLVRSRVIRNDMENNESPCKSTTDGAADALSVRKANPCLDQCPDFL